MGSDRQKRKIVDTFCATFKRVKRKEAEQAVGIGHDDTSPCEIKSDRRGTVFRQKPIEIKKPIRKKWHEKEPVVKPLLVGDKEVRRRTRFRSERELLLFIFIICNGQFDIIGDTCSAMSWYEECFFYFEMIYRRTIRRWIDAASEKEYGLDEKYLRKVFDDKVKRVNACGESWPTYVSFEEDFYFMSEEWKERYKLMRVIFWDNTNVNAYKMSAAELQKQLTRHITGGMFSRAEYFCYCAVGLECIIFGQEQ